MTRHSKSGCAVRPFSRLRVLSKVEAQAHYPVFDPEAQTRREQNRREATRHYLCMQDMKTCLRAVDKFRKS